MTYIFDENLSPQIVKVLNYLDQDVHHLFDIFPRKPTGEGLKDEEFLPTLGQKGDILVTFDRAMRRPSGKDGHGAILKAYKVKVIFLPKSFQSNPAGIPVSNYPSVAWKQCAWMLLHWHEISEKVSHMENWSQVQITDKGNVNILV